MLTAVLVASVLLLVGFVLRAALKPLQWLFIPASVAGGILGLVVFQSMLAAGGDAAEVIEPVAAEMRGWPGFLIAIVFAGLLLEHPGRSFVESLRGAAVEGVMVWIIVLGEVTLGLLAAWALIAGGADLPPAFGQLIEAGFAGGHGTAAALGEVFANEEVVGFADGAALGFVMATIGLLYSIVSGIALVNIAVRRGWTRSGRVEIKLSSGLVRSGPPRPIGLGRSRSEVLDPLALQLVIVAVALLLGMAYQWAFSAAVAQVIDLGWMAEDVGGYLGNLPLFLFALLGGWSLRGVMTRLGVGDLIDGESVKRIVAVAMEFLIVAAVASLRIEVVAAYLGPLLLLCAVGFVWTVFCLLVLSRLILPPAYWFELGIINYGMSTGTTAQGMMLLRIVDEDLESGAAEDYALAAPLSAPFVGGGVITLSLPLLLDQAGLPAVVGVLAAALLILFFVGRAIRVRKTPGPATE